MELEYIVTLHCASKALKDTVRGKIKELTGVVIDNIDVAPTRRAVVMSIRAGSDTTMALRVRPGRNLFFVLDLISRVQMCTARLKEQPGVAEMKFKVGAFAKAINKGVQDGYIRTVEDGSGANYLTEAGKQKLDELRARYNEAVNGGDGPPDDRRSQLVVALDMASERDDHCVSTTDLRQAAAALDFSPAGFATAIARFSSDGYFSRESEGRYKLTQKGTQHRAEYHARAVAA